MQANGQWRSFKPDARKGEAASQNEADLKRSSGNLQLPPVPQLPAVTTAEQLGQSKADDIHGKVQAEAAIQPPSSKLPDLPASPFSGIPTKTGGKEEQEANGAALQDNSPYSPSNQTKFHWPDSPRQSFSEREHAAQQVRPCTTLAAKTMLPVILPALGISQVFYFQIMLVKLRAIVLVC